MLHGELFPHHGLEPVGEGDSLIAGPIMRYCHLSHLLRERRIDSKSLNELLSVILTGLAFVLTMTLVLNKLFSVRWPFLPNGIKI